MFPISYIIPLLRVAYLKLMPSKLQIHLVVMKMIC